MTRKNKIRKTARMTASRRKAVRVPISSARARRAWLAPSRARAVPIAALGRAKARPYNFVSTTVAIMFGSTNASVHQACAMNQKKAARVWCSMSSAWRRQAACREQAKARPYTATDLYPIGLLHSTLDAIFPGLLIRIADAEQEMGHLCF